MLASVLGLAATLGAFPLAGQDPVVRIPLVSGLALGSTLHSAAGEREDLLEIQSADTGGVHYAWHERTITREGDTTTGFRKRFVRANDLAGAPRFDDLFGREEVKRPGFTAVSVSSAVYRQLRDAGATPYSMIMTPPTAGGESAAAVASLLSTGARALQGHADPRLPRIRAVPADRERAPRHRAGAAPAGELHQRSAERRVGRVGPGRQRPSAAAQVGARATPCSRWSGPTCRPTGLDVAAACWRASSWSGSWTRAAGSSCPASTSPSAPPPSIRSPTGPSPSWPACLARHRDWRFTVEGHTDSVGTVAANQALSKRRAEAVLARLGTQHGVDTRGWGAAGFGAGRPREPNATIEGRARNRRVELVRDCR